MKNVTTIDRIVHRTTVPYEDFAARLEAVAQALLAPGTIENGTIPPRSMTMTDDSGEFAANLPLPERRQLAARLLSRARKLRRDLAAAAAGRAGQEPV